MKNKTLFPPILCAVLLAGCSPPKEVAPAPSAVAAPAVKIQLSSYPPATVIGLLLSIAVIAAVTEELAYRGYLLRRLVKPDFESVAFREIRWPVLALVSVAFGATHGALWLPGVGAGFAFGLLVIKSGRIGEAAAAHAIANALLAGYVLSFDQWQLW